MCLKSGDSLGALRVLKKASDIEPTLSLCINIADLSIKSHDPDGAFHFLRLADSLAETDDQRALVAGYRAIAEKNSDPPEEGPVQGPLG